jgi:tetratricopeptide (TPR) repeat protein
MAVDLSAPRIPGRRGLPWLAAAFLIFGSLGAWMVWSSARLAHQPPISLALGPPEGWDGITPGQRQGILILLQDHLEIQRGCTVVEEANLDSPSDGVSVRIILGGRRTSERLALNLEIHSPGGQREQWSFPAADPRQGFAALMRRFGGRVVDHPVLLPRDPGQFWKLAEATGCRIDQDPTQALGLIAEVIQTEPDCAAARATLAALTYWELSRGAGRSDLEQFQRCDALFQKAFERVPHYPRPVDDYVGYKTDIGNPREAMETAFAALKAYPRAAHLHGSLAYPARTSGLLEGASRAIQARDALVGPHRFERNQVENTYLYRGDFDRFEWTLGPGSDLTPEPSRDFYRGYINLLKGRPERALPFFIRAQRVKGSWAQFEALARVFELALSNHREKARQELLSLRADRALLRVPDGEFTFKLAEAFAYLGDGENAIETAQRAFAQGFGCTRWYQESPLLADVPRQARWNALMQHLRERQQLMESAFPAGRFGPR